MSVKTIKTNDRNQKISKDIPMPNNDAYPIHLHYKFPPL